jgi:hypothetical protein
MAGQALLRIAHSRVLAALLLVCLLVSPHAGFGQGQAAPVGALRATGDVTVNGAAVTGMASVFAGDTVRTGRGGAAGITVAGRGTLVLGEWSEVSLPATTRFFAALKQGTVGLRALEGARNFQLQAGNFVVVPGAEAESAAEVFRAADGATQVTCTAGTMGVIALEGEQSLFLHPGQTASISAQGSLWRGTGLPTAPGPGQPPPPQTPPGTPTTQPPTAPPTAPPSAPPVAKKKNGAVIGVLIGAGAAGAVLALAGKKKDSSTPVSPSVP